MRRNVEFVVGMSDCPQTYASMIAYVDAHGHVIDRTPKGHVDPHTLTIELPLDWNPKPNERSITIWVRVGQGTRVDAYLCRVRPATAVAATRPEAGTTALTEAATCRHANTSFS